MLLRSPRLRRAVLWTVGLVAAYAAIGFLLVPPIAKAVLQSKLGDALHRKVAIERIAFNPFTLEAEISGFSVQTAEGHEVLGFDTLHADLQAASIFSGGPVLREFRLDGPRLSVTRLSADRYDISDLIEEWSKPSDSPTPGFSVSNIQISGGKITLADKPKGVTHTVGDLVFRLPFLSSLPYQAEIFIEPYFSARINGAPLVLEGRSKPFAASHESELRLDLDNAELMRYLPYSPVALPFAVRGGSLDTELKLVFKQNADHPATLHLVGALHLKDLRLAEKEGAPLLAWKKLDVTVHEADLLRRRFAIDSVHFAGLEANARLGAQGKLNWLYLADRLAAPSTASEAKAKSAPPTWSVREVRIEDGTLRYQDQGRPQLAAQVIDHINARIGGLSSEAGKKLAVEIGGRVNESGSLKAGGEVQLQPLVANLDVDVSGLPLLPLQPYFSDRLNLTLTSGQLSAQGSLSLQDGDNGLGGGFKGQLTLGDVQSVDKVSNADFLKWKSLFFDKVDARLQPLSLSVGEVALSDFYARMIVTPQGKLNLLQLVRRPEAPPAPPATEKETVGRQTTAVVPPAPDREIVPINIGKVSLQGGTINFSDYFVKPNYTVNVTKIAGRINGLSSAAGTLADLELRGSYGNSAPVQVLAKLNPLAAKTYLDLKGEIRGVDLTTLSTYSAKYAGYAIEEGKLSLFVTYHLENNQLTADNRVFLDQLAFGDKVNSPEATTLPVKLAVALLKNSRGEIDVNLPISGSIDDPQFSLGGVITRVIGNLILKAVTSPFALLGQIFGGGEELSTLDFDPGRVNLVPAATKKLEALAKAMNDRPALKLEISGRADPEADREGLKQVALEYAVKAEKQKEMIKRSGGAPDLDDIEIDPKEYPGYLQRAYQEAKFPKPRNLIGLLKSLPVEEMEKLMLANLPVGEKELHELADRRAEAAEAWLVDQGKVPPERVFVVAPKLTGDNRDGKASPSRVDFSLR